MAPKGTHKQISDLGRVEKCSNGWRVVLPRMRELGAKSNTNGPVTTRAEAKQSLVRARQCLSRRGMIAFVHALRANAAPDIRGRVLPGVGQHGDNGDAHPVGDPRDGSGTRVFAHRVGRCRKRLRKKTRPEAVEWIAAQELAIIGGSQSAADSKDPDTQKIAKGSRTCGDAEGCGRILCDQCYPPGWCGKAARKSSADCSF